MSWLFSCVFTYLGQSKQQDLVIITKRKKEKVQSMTKYYNQRYRVLLCTFIRTLSYFLQDGLQNAPDYFRIFSGLFENISRNVWRHSPECLRIFPGIFGDIPRNVWRHSPECLRTFPGLFGDIFRNVWRHSPECLRTFPRMISDILRNVWRHAPEYNIPPIPRVPRSCILVFIYTLSKYHKKMLRKSPASYAWAGIF